MTNTTGAHKSFWFVMTLVVWLASCARPAPYPALPTPLGKVTPTGQVAEAAAPTVDPTAIIASLPSPSVPTAPPPTQPAASAKTQYTVRPGDTLLGVALLQHISMASIQLANNMGESDMLRAGQTLEIHTGPQWDGELPYWIVHTVQRGETVIGIARSFGLTVNDILRVNAMADPGQIYPGQPIIIPLDSLWAAAAPPTPLPKPTATATVSRVSASSLTSPLVLPPTPMPTVLPTSVPVSVPPNIAAWPGTVVTLINQKRAAHGLPLYSASPELMRAALAHAADCTARGWCGHVGSDGSDTRTREIRAGYHPTAWGENWVQAFDPVQAVEWWYNETPPNDPHRKNLLHARYTQVGIGITAAGNGYYFIADFGDP